MFAEEGPPLQALGFLTKTPIPLPQILMLLRDITSLSWGQEALEEVFIVLS